MSHCDCGQVSEALSVGLPVVMSSFTHDSFGTVPGCIGSNKYTFKQCILEVHNDKQKWTELREQGLEFIRTTHSEEEVIKRWSYIISTGLKLSRRRNDLFQRSEEEYKKQYPDIADALAAKVFLSALHHYSTVGKHESRLYRDADILSILGI